MSLKLVYSLFYCDRRKFNLTSGLFFCSGNWQINYTYLLRWINYIDKNICDTMTMACGGLLYKWNQWSFIERSKLIK